jgi:hypothetical protein
MEGGKDRSDSSNADKGFFLTLRIRVFMERTARWWPEVPRRQRQRMEFTRYPTATGCTVTTGCSVSINKNMLGASGSERMNAI